MQWLERRAPTFFAFPFPVQPKQNLTSPTLLTMTADPREARFLASQAERLADNKRHQKSRRNQLRSNDDGHHQSSSQNDFYSDDDAPNLYDDENNVKFNTDLNNNDDHHVSQKEEGHRFWTNFRKLCSELQSQVDFLLTPNNEAVGAADDGGGTSKYDSAKAYYSTAARRSQGRVKLDSILDIVRLLRRHCLSSSSMLATATPSAAATTNDDGTTANQLLHSILSTPMPAMAQTDMRLLSEEIDRLLKCIDEARTIISPKEKFVFKRYRKAMEEKRLLGDGNCLVGGEESAAAGLEPSKLEETNEDEQAREETFNHDGAVLENKSDCTIEIFPHGNIKVNEATQTQIQYYSRPRRIISLHPPSFNNVQQHDTTSSSSDSMSYLLQNLTNVTILLHGSRPTLHLKNIHNCHVYVTEPTMGPVHLTNCHSSEIRCSCYQLRIHDSNHVKFGVWVRSGPIIENCKEIVFEGNYYLGDEKSCGDAGKNMYWDVKDFNWLRTLRKSPNFVVVVADSNEGGGLKEEKLVSGEEGVGASVCVQDNGKVPSQEEEEDSDDEL